MRMRVSMRRAAIAAGLLVAVMGLPSTSSAAEKEIAKAACGNVPKIQLIRTLRGFRMDHSGDIQLFTREPDYVGSGLPHIAPFDYIQEVPMLWYGPGYIKAQGAVKRPVLTPDIAPTEAALLNFAGFRSPDGKVMGEALEPAAQRKEPPRLIVTYVWDASGDVVLDRWKKNHPYLDSLIPEGTWYENATIASSPASTAQIHAEMGTGAFPRNHAVIGHHYRMGSTHAAPWKGVPTMPILPTLADLYDLANDNEPKIALSGTVAIHMGMESHGGLWGGGDKDIAVLREADAAVFEAGQKETLGAEGVEWKLTPALEPYFTFPSYANELGGIDDYFKETDMLDGKQDGTWRGHELSLDDKETLGGFETPARVGYQFRLVEEMIKREDLGQDDVPDMLMINNKLIDSMAHLWRGLDGIEMGDSVKMQDRYLEKFVNLLNQEVGEGKWAMVLTADHGATPFPKASGAFVISPGKVGNLITAEFDTDGDDQPIIGGAGADIGGVGGFVQPTQIFLDHQELADNKVSIEQVAKFVMDIPKSQVNENAPPTGAEADEPAFAAAVPADMLAGLPCVKGDG